jgi:TetR/AcrR family transcriptional regulator
MILGYLPDIFVKLEPAYHGCARIQHHHVFDNKSKVSYNLTTWSNFVSGGGAYTVNAGNFEVNRVSLQTFEKLPENERNRIISACASEFAHHGYGQASTNHIVKQLGIPKGSLFYWFGNKDGLYLYLVDLAMKRFVAVFADAARDWPNEILARFRILIEASLAFLEQNPDHYRLVMTFMDGEARHLLGTYMKEHWQEGLSVWADWFSGVDTSDFRTSQHEVYQLLMWVLAGIKLEMFALIDRHDPVGGSHPQFIAHIDMVIRLLSHAIYHHPERWGYA